MEFKIDENLPVEIADILEAAGHDAITVLDQNLGGCEDSKVIEVCNEEKRILVTQLELVLDLIVIDRPEDVERNFCVDKGYSGRPAYKVITDRNYIPHVRSRGEGKQEKKTDPRFKARRWVVEAAHPWFNRFRKLLVRYEKRNDTYLALLHLAAATIAFRKTGIIYG